MTTPQPILDKIAELEDTLADKQEEIARFGLTISTLQQRVLEECRTQDEVLNRLDLLRFVVDIYDALLPQDDPAPEVTENWGSAAPDETQAATTGNGAQPTSTKERVYAAMGQMEGPATATQIAEVIGAEDYRVVAPVFAVLRREGKIRPSGNGGWVRTPA